MNLTLNTQATILLTSYFGEAKSNELKPLSDSEWAILAKFMIENDATPQDFLEKPIEQILDGWNNEKIAKKRIKALLERGHSFAIAMEKWHRAGLWVMSRSDPEYPKRLKARLKMQSPPVLFGCGDKSLLNDGGLAVVGAQKAPQEDLLFAKRLGVMSAGNNTSIIVGGSKGVDENAISGAINSGGFVIGVLSEGLLRASSSKLWRSALIQKKAVLISPFYPESRLLADHVLVRNKCLYCLSDAAMVVYSGQFEEISNGVKDNLQNNWVPTWIKSADNLASENDYLIKLGAQRFNSQVEHIKFQDLFNFPLVEPELKPEDDVSRPEISLIEKVGNKASISENIKDDEISVHVLQEDLFDHEVISNQVVGTDKLESISIDEDVIQAEKSSPQQIVDNEIEDSFFQFFIREMKMLAVTPVEREQIYEKLSLHRTQANIWLKKAEEQGYLKKFYKPLRYQFKESK
jgi:predicted Rossmann fold nucleotide-binding protein DprA/Smf involved in DNA uptake